MHFLHCKYHNGSMDDCNYPIAGNLRQCKMSWECLWNLQKISLPFFKNEILAIQTTPLPSHDQDQYRQSEYQIASTMTKYYFALETISQRMLHLQGHLDFHCMWRVDLVKGKIQCWWSYCVTVAMRSKSPITSECPLWLCWPPLSQHVNW